MKRKFFWLCLIVLLSNNSFAGDGNIKESYYPTGEVEVRYIMKDGAPHGLSKKFDKRGNLIQEREYQNGKSLSPVKTWKYYDSNKIKSEFAYDHGNGYRKDYFSNGQIHHQYDLKGGSILNYQEYDKDGNIVVKQDGLFTGSIKEFDDNGDLKVERVFKEGLLFETRDSFLKGKDISRTSVNVDDFLKKDPNHPFVGLWKTDCSEDSGFAVQALGQTPFYNLILCTKEGCMPEAFSKKTMFYKDKDFRVMDEDRFRMKTDGQYIEYHRCE